MAWHAKGHGQQLLKKRKDQGSALLLCTAKLQARLVQYAPALPSKDIWGSSWRPDTPALPLLSWRSARDPCCVSPTLVPK